MLDDIYEKYLMDKDEKVFCRDMKSFFSGMMSADKKHINVTIVNCSIDAKEPFFGMRIFPDASEIDGICQEILEDKLIPIGRIIDRWKHISSWE